MNNCLLSTGKLTIQYEMKYKIMTNSYIYVFMCLY